jgi:hypothetical protein
MCDDLDDWELKDFTFPITIIQSEEVKKRLEERKLVEESDMAIAKKLFGNDDYCCELEIKNKLKPLQFEKPKKFISKQYENELKQKELAKIRRENKSAQARHIEMYGECVQDEYSQYEDKFNN